MTEFEFRAHVRNLPRSTKQALTVTSDFFGLLISIGVAAWLVAPGAAEYQALAWPTALTLLVTLLLAAQMGFYQSIVRYVGIAFALAGINVMIVSGVALGAVTFAWGVTTDPARLAIGYTALGLLYLLGSRHAARRFLNQGKECTERVIVYGAGEAGAHLVLSIQDGNTFKPVGLVDDDPQLHRKRVGGLPVHSPVELGRLIQELDVSRVLLALPSVSRRRRQEIIANLEPLAVHVQKIPDLNDLVTGKARVDEISEVGAVDLLGRDSVPPDTELLELSVKGKSVMVTGAGGSIGSELCRQVLNLSPRTLVLFEMSEFALYDIDKELRRRSADLGVECEIVPLLGSVHHEDRVREVMQAFGVETVYHAAAYKHVPVVEQNILEGVHNNVFGTLHTARAAANSGVERFVLVSTDKAVNPTNVMGATKRLSELVLQAMQGEYPDVRFCMVRFGNVLESSGSVVPLFREQICAGGPVTVTHRDIIRYFMTIPEAAQLVIQAGAMAGEGDVFVLDMGDPVKIVNLARRMIMLMGLTVRDEDNSDGDIEIEYTGLRPAEKLFEELLLGSNVVGTKHPRIMRASEDHVPADELFPALDRLKVSSQHLDRDAVRKFMMEFVAGYEPKNGIDDLVSVKVGQAKARSKSKTVVSLPQVSA